MTSPTILAFDTSGPWCSAAVFAGGQVTALRVDEMARGQAEHLMPMLQAILAEAGLDWTDLTALGVGVGPGNFTGIRIGVSAARGLSMGLGIPATGVSRFDTTARLANWAQVTVPAPRDQVYVWDPDKMTAPMVAPAADISGTTAPYDAHDTAAHIRCLAQITAERGDTNGPAPAPLYIKSADAAPSRDVPPEILD